MKSNVNDDDPQLPSFPPADIEKKKSFTDADIEKRKSFADMKLAEVATSPEFWDPDKHPPKSEEKVAKKTEPPQPEEKEKNGKQQCNGHPDKAGEDERVAEVMGNGENGAGDKDAAAGSSPMNVDLIPPQLPSQAGKVVVDPVTEVVPDMEVKIADLGNACWVVSSLKSFKQALLGLMVHKEKANLKSNCM